MTAWILIITIFAGGPSGGVYIEHIDFSSQKKCLDAGNLYQKQIPGSGVTCVEK